MIAAPHHPVRRPSLGAAALIFALAGCAATEAESAAPAAPQPEVDAGPREDVAGGDAAPSPREVYVTSVDPELAASCKACHASGASGAPVFLAADPGASYDLLVSSASLYQRPLDSELLLHGEHAGPALNAAQAAKVTAWLELEFPAQDPPPEEEEEVPDLPTAAQALTEFSKCMSYDDWVTTGMDVFPQTQTAFGPCQGCHGHGNGGTFLSDDPQETFERNRARPYVNKLVRPRYVGGAFVGLEPNDRFLKKGITSCVEEDICHPQYVLSTAQANSVGLFQAKTLGKLVNGVCIAP